MLNQIIPTIAAHLEEKTQNQVVVVDKFERAKILAACDRRMGVTDLYSPLIQIINSRSFTTFEDDTTSCGSKILVRVPITILKVDVNGTYNIPSLISAIRTIPNTLFQGLTLLTLSPQIEVIHNYEEVFMRLFREPLEPKYSDKVSLSLYNFYIQAYMPINCLTPC